MFEVKCTGCGNQTTVPFKPTPGKPVYCRTCFSKQANNRYDSNGGGNHEGFGPNRSGQDEETTGKQTERKRLPASFKDGRLGFLK